MQLYSCLGNYPGMKLSLRSSVVRFFSSHIVAGIFWVMVLFGSNISVTEFPVQTISGQSHGDDVEFQDWRDGGLPNCCLSLRRMVRSLAV